MCYYCIVKNKNKKMLRDLNLSREWWSSDRYEYMLNRRASWLISAIIFPNNPDRLTDLMSKIRSGWDDRDL